MGSFRSPVEPQLQVILGFVEAARAACHVLQAGCAHNPTEFDESGAADLYAESETAEMQTWRGTQWTPFYLRGMGRWLALKDLLHYAQNKDSIRAAIDKFAQELSAMEIDIAALVLFELSRLEARLKQTRERGAENVMEHARRRAELVSGSMRHLTEEAPFLDSAKFGSENAIAALQVVRSYLANYATGDESEAA